MRATQLSFSSSCPEESLKSLLLVSYTGRDHTAHILLRKKTVFCQLAVSKRISLLATEKWLSKWWFYLHLTASHFLWLQDSSRIHSARFCCPSHTMLCWLGQFPHDKYWPCKKAASYWFDIVKFVVFNGFSCKRDCWRFFVSCFSYNAAELKCCWSNIFKQQEAFYFQGYRWNIPSSLNHIHKGFSISFVWHFMLSTAVVRTISEIQDLSHDWVEMSNLEKQIFMEGVKRPGR